MKIFTEMEKSQRGGVRQSTFTIWIDDSSSHWNPIQSNRNVIQWRLFISGDELCEEALDLISSILKRRVGWVVTGWQHPSTEHSTPIFRYERGDFQVFFIRERAEGGSGRVGYLDIESDGVSHRLGFVEMDVTHVDRVCITSRSGKSRAFQVRFIHALIRDEPVRIETDAPADLSPDEPVDKPENARKRSDCQIRRAQIFYLNNFLTLSSCIE